MYPAFLTALIAMLGLGNTLGAGSAASAGVIGPDNRVVIEETDRRWQAVGRLNRETGGFCTAFLVGPREALTAAHCLWDQTRRSWVEPETLHFVPGYRRGTYLGHAKVIRYRLAEDITIDTRGHPVRLLDDWAILELTLDLSAAAGVEPMALAENDERDQLTTMPLASGGYSRDRPHLPVKVEPCRALGMIEHGRLLLHDCDSQAGSSGSPIVVERDGRLVVIGIQSAVVSAGSEAIAVAVLMHRRPAQTSLLSQ